MMLMPRRLLKRLRSPRASVLYSLALIVVLAAACGSSESTDTQGSTNTPPKTAAARLASVGRIQDADPNFDFTAMSWQAYWLLRDLFGPFVMASGMGIPFQPPMGNIQMAQNMVAQNPAYPVMIPQNMMPLQAVFASGSPDLINDPRDFSPMDFEGFRLDSDSFDRTIAIRGQAETMLKEAQWAHTFESAHMGKPTGDFGAEQRFMGVMIAMIAQMQGQYAMQNLMGEDGLYHDSDGNVDYIGNWVMLHALSDLALLTGETDGNYKNLEAHSKFDGSATQLFHALETRQPATAPEGAAAIRVLIYRAYTASDGAVRNAAMAKAQLVADTEMVGSQSQDVVENSAAMVGLIAIAAATGRSEYQDAAELLFRRVADDYDPTYGVFKSKDIYNVDDVAWIIGGHNYLTKKGDDSVRDASRRILLGFYESTISLAGMQLSAPPGKNGAMAGEWEKNLPNVLYYHPTNTPPPPVAGKLTVPAEEIRWDGQEWQITSDRFGVAGAMHLANELNWLGPPIGSIPFPLIVNQGS